MWAPEIRAQKSCPLRTSRATAWYGMMVTPISDRTSAFRRLFTNRWLWGAIALSALLQVAVVQLPFLNDAFDTAPLGRHEWLISLGLASVVLWAGEAKKLVERRLRKRP